MPDAPDLVTDIFEALQLHAFGGRALAAAARSGIRFPGRNEPHPPRPPAGIPLHRYINRPPDAILHILTHGRADLRVDALPGATALAPGDLVVVLHGRGHQLQDAADVAPRPIWEVIEQDQRSPLRANDSAWGVLGGVVHCMSPTALRIVNVLPPIIHVPKRQCKTPMWIDELLHVVAREGASRAPGSGAVANRIMHLFFILAVRACISEMPASSRSWLGAFLDPDLGPAIAMMHARPDHRWTVSALAEEASMSRSAFAAKFTQRIGQPPLQYLTQTRMESARQLLEDPERSLKEIAKAVGYLSEAAFSNAFRRFTGVYPGGYRKELLGPGDENIEAAPPL